MPHTKRLLTHLLTLSCLVTSTWSSEAQSAVGTGHPNGHFNSFFQNSFISRLQPGLGESIETSTKEELDSNPLQFNKFDESYRNKRNRNQQQDAFTNASDGMSGEPQFQTRNAPDNSQTHRIEPREEIDRMFSDIESAFSFLEDDLQSDNAEEHHGSRTLSNRVGRHNFVRFGKRAAIPKSVRGFSGQDAMFHSRKFSSPSSFRGSLLEHGIDSEHFKVNHRLSSSDISDFLSDKIDENLDSRKSRALDRLLAEIDLHDLSHGNSKLHNTRESINTDISEFPFTFRQTLSSNTDLLKHRNGDHLNNNKAKSIGQLLWDRGFRPEVLDQHFISSSLMDISGSDRIKSKDIIHRAMLLLKEQPERLDMILRHLKSEHKNKRPAHNFVRFGRRSIYNSLLENTPSSDATPSIHLLPVSLLNLLNEKSPITISQILRSYPMVDFLTAETVKNMAAAKQTSPNQKTIRKRAKEVVPPFL